MKPLTELELHLIDIYRSQYGSGVEVPMDVLLQVRAEAIEEAAKLCESIGKAPLASAIRSLARRDAIDLAPQGEPQCLTPNMCRIIGCSHKCEAPPKPRDWRDEPVTWWQIADEILQRGGTPNKAIERAAKAKL